MCARFVLFNVRCNSVSFRLFCAYIIVTSKQDDDNNYAQHSTLVYVCVHLGVHTGEQNQVANCLSKRSKRSVQHLIVKIFGAPCVQCTHYFALPARTDILKKHFSRQITKAKHTLNVCRSKSGEMNYTITMFLFYWFAAMNIHIEGECE